MRTVAVIKRIFQQMLRDKRAMALLFIVPLLVLTLMNLVFNGKTVDPIIGVENVNQEVINQFEKSDIIVKEFENVSGAESIIKNHGLDAFLKEDNDKTTLTLLNEDPTVSKGLQMKIKQILSANLQSQLMQKSELQMKQSPQDTLKTNYLYGSENTEFFDVMSPILIGFFVFFFVFLISGMGLLKEKTTGTLERLMATPIRRGEIVVAYLIGFGVFAVIQTIIVVLFAINVLDIVLIGSIWNVILINLLLSLVALSLGLLLSSFAASEFQMVQFIPIVIIPQVFFSGIFPLEGMANWLKMFSKIMPIYYAGDALIGVMYKGLSFSDIINNLYILMGLAALFITINLFVLKKYRKL
ncbi:ABC transporter permease [Alkalihalobacillus sp. BA299]|uniref:ABC transporter permease n=1 Tax=Alkalihalobacillus sp. BA299 TaxID=2815938 RepID=UPI001ADB2E9D|nr:ABC transporter permease [Alkalihalobacillus sp. BA299]